MIKANFSAYASYVTDSLYQWDKNQVLSVSGLNVSTAPEVHFSNANMDKAIVKQSTLTDHVVNVKIPNSLLQDPLTIQAHIGIYVGDTFKVIERVEIPIIPRKRPADYTIETTDEEIYSFEALRNALANKADDSRVDNIIAHNNDTDGNTELLDMRVDIDGEIHASAGDAVRGQIERVNADIDVRIKKDISPNLFDKRAIKDGLLQGDWENIGFTSYWHSDYIKNNSDGKIYFSQLPAQVSFYLNEKWVGGYTSEQLTNEGDGWYSVEFPNSHDGFAVCARKSAEYTPYIDVDTFMIAVKKLEKYYGFETSIMSYGEKLALKDDIPVVPETPLFIQGESNFFIGKECGINTEESMEGQGQNGRWNCAIGTRAMRFNISGDHCTAIGFQAMQNNTTGDANTALGEDALYENTTGGDNTAVGTHSLQNAITAFSNTAVGASALMGDTTGFSNTAIGAEAGYHGSTPIREDDRCTFIGMRTGKNTENVISNSTAVGYGAKVTKSNQMVFGNSDVSEYILGNKKIIFNDDGTVTWEFI